MFFAQPTKDPFGEDPFANLHAPTRAESPSPALPPKKAKQPPPRPAPPRPASTPGGPGGPLRAAPAPPTPSPTPDPFANANSDPFAAQPTLDNTNGNTFMSSTTSFADFANFDSKVPFFYCFILCRLFIACIFCLMSRTKCFHFLHSPCTVVFLFSLRGG